MLARGLLGLLVVELCGYAALLYAALDGSLAIPLALAVIAVVHVALRCAVVPLGVLVALASEPRGSRPRLAWFHALRVFGAECAALWCNYVLAPFAPWLPSGTADRQCSRAPGPGGAGVPRDPHCPEDLPTPADLPVPDVVLVHGILCNRVVWRPFLAALRSAGHVARTVEVEPVLGSLDAMALDLARTLRQRESGRPLVLVGHSMGGLVARRLLQLDPALPIASLVTIGTPHRGSAVARFLPVEAARSMRPGAAWLLRLDEEDGVPRLDREAGARCAPAAPGADLRRRALRRLAISSQHDELVSPPGSARWPAARELVIDGVGHVALLADARVVDAVVRELDAVVHGPAAPTTTRNTVSRSEPLPCSP